MLATILISLYSIVMLVIYGAGFLSFARKVLKIQPAEPPTLWQAGFAGFIPLIWITSLISIFLPISETAAFLLLIGAVGLAIGLVRSHPDWVTVWRQSFQKQHILTWLTICISLVTTLVLSTLKPGNSDTGLYHAQAIRWIETFPVVPGLGNLHSRLAYNSNWFPLQAGFSFAFLDLRSFHLMGAVLTGLCLVYFGGGLQGLIKADLRLSHWMRLAFLPLTFYVLASEISSTGTDLPVTLFTWVILCVWLDTLEKPSGSPDWRHVLLVSLPVMLVSIKLSAFPLLLVTLWVLVPGLRTNVGRRTIWSTIIFVLLFCLPWLARNVIISGYLVYPQTMLDIFNVPWKMPIQGVKDEAEWIVSWARFPRMDKELVLAMPVTQWAPMWFDDLSKNRQIILLVLAAAPFGFGLAALTAWIFFRKSFKDWFHPFTLSLPLWLVTYTGILFWFFSVPRYRFGNGVLMAGLVLVVLCGLGLFRSILKPMTRFIPSGLAVLIIGYTVFVLATSYDPKTLPVRWILPADYVNLPTEPCGFSNFGVACATQYQQCGYKPFPCVPQVVPNVYMRGKSFGDGFEVR